MQMVCVHALWNVSSSTTLYCVFGDSLSLTRELQMGADLNSWLHACATSTPSTLPAHLIVREHGGLCGVTCSLFLMSLFM